MVWFGEASTHFHFTEVFFPKRCAAKCTGAGYQVPSFLLVVIWIFSSPIARAALFWLSQLLFVVVKEWKYSLFSYTGVIKLVLLYGRGIKYGMVWVPILHTHPVAVAYFISQECRKMNQELSTVYCAIVNLFKIKTTGCTVRGTRRLSYLAAVLIWQDNFTR